METNPFCLRASVLTSLKTQLGFFFPKDMRASASVATARLLVLSNPLLAELNTLLDVAS